MDAAVFHTADVAKPAQPALRKKRVNAWYIDLPYNFVTNKEVYDLYKDPTLVAEIKKGRLCWTGHLERMPKTRAAKVVYAQNPGGK